jgi:hypothetical protein
MESMVVGMEKLVRDINEALHDMVPPKNVSKLRQEYWKAGARDAIMRINYVLSKHRPTSTSTPPSHSSQPPAEPTSP